MSSNFNALQVFKRRQNRAVEFFRNWEEYANGFGNKSGEFWLGDMPQK